VAQLSVIVVSWNTRELLQRCLGSVFASAADVAGLDVIVADNASVDGSAEMVAARFPQVTLIRNLQNVGFAAANNQAVQLARGDFLLFLNSDTEIVGAAIHEMLRYATDHPDVAVLGPQLLNSDGTVQPSRRRFPTVTTAFLESTVLQRWFPNHPALRAYYLLDRSDHETQEVDWLVGACLLVRSEAAKQVGLMDEGYYMYSEELDWCRRFAAAGWRIVYHPVAKVIHHGGQSSDQDLFRRHILFQHSKCRYFERYHGRPFAQLLRVFVLSNYIFMLIEDVAKLLLLRRNRSMRRQRISTLSRVVAWQFRWVARRGEVPL